MRKLFFLGMLFILKLCTPVPLVAQGLDNLLLSSSGKATYLINVDSVLAEVDDSGKLLQITTRASGTIVYRADRKIEKIGGLTMTYNYQDKLSMIGDKKIIYDYAGRLDRIGELGLKYNYSGLMIQIGGHKMMYNANSQLDGFDNYRVRYNYNKQIQSVDNSNGLIILQLIGDK